MIQHLKTKEKFFYKSLDTKKIIVKDGISSNVLSDQYGLFFLNFVMYSHFYKNQKRKDEFCSHITAL
jgi:hypothetical protein